MTTSAAFSTCDMCDAHKGDDSGSFWVLPPVFQCFGGVAAFRGPVSTVKCFEDNTLVKAAVDSPGQGRVLVVDGGGSLRRALVGGNLALIGSTLGTPWEIDTHDAILFIEDVGEPPYKIDRLLTQLRLAGKLGGVRGVLIGDFSDVSAAGASAEQVALDAARLQRLWQEFFLPLNVPVLAGWRSGHVDPNLTLPIGAVVTLDADRQGVRVEQALVV